MLGAAASLVKTKVEPSKVAFDSPIIVFAVPVAVTI
jgi:hypothetical protein